MGASKEKGKIEDTKGGCFWIIIIGIICLTAYCTLELLVKYEIL
jgi:hypothetical protein